MEFISINDVKGCQNDILNMTHEIFYYINSINHVLESMSLDDYKIDENKFKFTIVKNNSTNYEDDGNTETKGYKYNIYWGFPLTEDAVDEWHSFKHGYSENTIIFEGEISTRVRDSKKNGCFSCYISKERLPNGYSQERLNYVASFQGSILNELLMVQLVKGVIEVGEINKIRQAIQKYISR